MFHKVYGTPNVCKKVWTFVDHIDPEMSTRVKAVNVCVGSFRMDVFNIHWMTCEIPTLMCGCQMNS